MKTKETIEKSPNFDKTLSSPSKPKSLRPMRSLMATRSLKPKTNVAHFVVETIEEKTKRN